MTWIAVIEPKDAQGPLADLYRRVAGPDGQVDNILKAHSLRPHTLTGHMGLYKNVLHHTGNRLPKSLLEAIGVRVSLINRCDYCVDHHAAGLRRLIADDGRSDRMIEALRSGRLEDGFDHGECALLRYAEKLTQEPSAITEDDIRGLRAAGIGDGEILEVNQVTAYFSYANRTVLGLGVTAAGEALGHSPASDDQEDWSHR